MSSSSITLASQSLGVVHGLTLNSLKVQNSQHTGPNMQQHVLTIKSEEEKKSQSIGKSQESKEIMGQHFGSTISEGMRKHTNCFG